MGKPKVIMFREQGKEIKEGAWDLGKPEAKTEFQGRVHRDNSKRKGGAEKRNRSSGRRAERTGRLNQGSFPPLLAHLQPCPPISGESLWLEDPGSHLLFLQVIPHSLHLP